MKRTNIYITVASPGYLACKSRPSQRTRRWWGPIQWAWRCFPGLLCAYLFSMYIAYLNAKGTTPNTLVGRFRYTPSIPHHKCTVLSVLHKTWRIKNATVMRMRINNIALMVNVSSYKRVCKGHLQHFRSPQMSWEIQCLGATNFQRSS